ncbi:TPA: hypothetical protein DEX28_01025 [Patescibacteria group bacterium]|nr:MAG: Acyl-CoA synthetases (AMP-forming)/AMP-acid ligases II [Candidatus Woesebacteria bacterium GW2011_GWC1_42_9]HCI05310.1 hypothetical protein [Patescibacteria group bacterium]
MNLSLAGKDRFKIISDFLDETALSFPDKVALVYEGSSYTYENLKKRSDKISDFLLKNTKKGDVVGILIQNAPDFVISYFGVLRSGCSVLLLSVNVSDKNLLLQIEKTRPKIFFSEQKLAEKLKRSGVDSKTLFFVNNIVSTKKPKTASDSFRTVSPEDVSTIIFTSGTTGAPKGIKLQHKNVVGATFNIIKFLKWRAKDIDVNVASLSHSFGIGNIHCIFAVGGTSIAYPDALNVKGILDVIEKYKATTLSLTPVTLRIATERFMLSLVAAADSLRFIQTNMSRLEKSLILSIISNLPAIDFHYYYGLTEASRSTFVTLNRHQDKLDSVGQPSPGVKIKIIEESGNILGPGKIGEICVKGNMVIKEYWDKQETQKRIKDGWLHTNDFGYLDEQGYLYISGRKDDIINVSGEKVSPEEVEIVIKRVPGVYDAVVIGLPDKLLGESVSAYVIAERSDFDLQSIIKECRKRLESYKVPQKIALIEKIPKTDNGKVQRTLFKKTIINK